MILSELHSRTLEDKQIETRQVVYPATTYLTSGM